MTDEIKAKIEARMLSGEPFTYSGLTAAFTGQAPSDVSRLVDRTIQELRKKGLIAYKRQGREAVWRKVEVVKDGGEDPQ